MICKQYKKETIFYCKNRIEIPSFLIKKDMETSRRNLSMSSVAPVKTAEIKKQVISGACTFFRLIYGGN
jgi:hypothetical protein